MMAKFYDLQEIYTHKKSKENENAQKLTFKIKDKMKKNFIIFNSLKGGNTLTTYCVL